MSKNLSCFLIGVISKTHISVSGPAKVFLVFRNMLWFVVKGTFYDIRILAWFQQQTSFREVSSGVIEPLTNLACNFDTIKEGSSLTLSGKNQRTLQLRYSSGSLLLTH